MLGDYPVHTTLPATDLQRAQRFYSETLGMTIVSEAPAGVFLESGGSRFLIFPSSGTSSGSHTQMGWAVDDIEQEVESLKAKGVEFQEYDLPSLKTVNGIATFGPIRSAWFKDSEGNVLGLVQFPS